MCFTRCSRLCRDSGAICLLAGLVLISGCEKGGPASTNCTSASFPSLKDRVDFLQRYVSFRRAYEALDFAILYSNNGGGMVPGPSEWDVRLVAVVPESEMAAWIPGSAPTPNADPAWLKSVPTSLDLSGVNEWYVNGRQTVGVDRTRRIVVYWNFTH